MWGLGGEGLSLLGVKKRTGLTQLRIYLTYAPYDYSLGSATFSKINKGTPINSLGVKKL